jgi:S-adenosylmethionine hydrolase
LPNVKQFRIRKKYVAHSAEVSFNRHCEQIVFRMSVITLISDLGLRDYYVAQVKAQLINLAPQCVLVDISHDVSPFSIDEAAFMLKSVWQQFPMGTVHLIGVNAEFTPDQPLIVVQHMSHYFVGADNGIFSLIFDDVDLEDIWEITLPLGEDYLFPMKGVLATSAAHLSKGGAPEFLGKRIDTIKRLSVPAVAIEPDLIRANVEYIDHYGNLFSNVTRDVFEQVRKGRNFRIEVTRSRFSISKISDQFAGVPPGEPMALWSTNGKLLLAMSTSVVGYGAGAAKLWGMKKMDPIRISFYGEENSEDDL